MIAVSRGIPAGTLNLVASNAEARQAAQRRCLHCCRVVSRPEDDMHIYGNITDMATWCAANISPRHVDWYYRGGGVWCFSEIEDMVQFQMVWQ